MWKVAHPVSDRTQPCITSVKLMELAGPLGHSPRTSVLLGHVPRTSVLLGERPDAMLPVGVVEWLGLIKFGLYIEKKVER